MTPMIVLLTLGLSSCCTPRQTQTPTGPSFRILTYNVNFGFARPDQACDAIRDADADIVCLQETTELWERFLRQKLAVQYPFMEFRESEARAAGGLAFLSKQRGKEVAYIRSNTRWFDGWIMEFSTAAGHVQVLNVHLQPPVTDRGSFGASGYFFTGDRRQGEIERFWSHLKPDLPVLVTGDFNEGEDGEVVRWLRKKYMTSALALYDCYTPTWKWKVGLITLKRRMDHIFLPPGFECFDARVIQAGTSDHFPVVATIGVISPASTPARSR